MITKDWTIALLLKEYPETLDILIEASPHFKKLNNKFLRKTLAPRVSIAQAASIGGVDADVLVNNLNKVVGCIDNNVHHPIEEQQIIEEEIPMNEKPDIIIQMSKQNEIILDVRPSIEAGIDPFKEIMKTIRSVKHSEVVHLINLFEPIPLYSILAEKGFDHWTEKIENVWNVYFYKSDTTSDKKNNSVVESEADTEHEDELLEIDVRGLEPPEPMMKILETLSQVDEHTILLVHHHREPMMLYEKLEERGFTAMAHKIEENYYKVIIRKKR